MQNKHLPMRDDRLTMQSASSPMRRNSLIYIDFRKTVIPLDCQPAWKLELLRIALCLAGQPLFIVQVRLYRQFYRHRVLGRIVLNFTAFKRRHRLQNLVCKVQVPLSSCDSSGCLMMSRSKHTTPPGGVNLPCSQLRSVATAGA